MRRYYTDDPPTVEQLLQMANAQRQAELNTVRSYIPKTTSDSTRTQNLVAKEEKLNEGRKAQEARVAEEMKRKANAEIRPQNSNPLNYASNNPQTQIMDQQMQINALNPQTWYRPGYDYTGQYFTPEQKAQAAREAEALAEMTFGAAVPWSIPFVLGNWANEAMVDDLETRNAINWAMAVTPVGGKRSAKQMFQKGTETVKNIGQQAVNKTKSSVSRLSAGMNPDGQFVFRPYRDFSIDDVLSGYYDRRYLQHMSGSNYGNKGNIRKMNERLFRGGIRSDVFVPKKSLDDSGLDIAKKNIDSRRQTKRLHNSVGNNAKPENYYRVSTEELLLSQMPTKNANTKTFDNLSRVVEKQLKTKAKNATIPVYYNPNTSRRPGVVLRTSAFIDIPTAAGIGAYNTYKTIQNQYNETEADFNIASDPQYQKFQNWLYTLPDTNRMQVNTIINNYMSNPYDSVNYTKYNQLRNALIQQYGNDWADAIDTWTDGQSRFYK